MRDEIRALRDELVELRGELDERKARGARWRRRLVVGLAVGGVAAIALGAVTAYAAPTTALLCDRGDFYCFSAGTAAKAAEVNHNFEQITRWIEQKVGAVGVDRVDVHNNFAVRNVADTGDVFQVESSGNVHVWGRQISQVTRCRWYQTDAWYTAGQWVTHGWQANDCDNGRPSGSCFAALEKVMVSYTETDPQALNPGEEGLTYGGARFWMDQNQTQNSTVDFIAVYFCGPS